MRKESASSTVLELSGIGNTSTSENLLYEVCHSQLNIYAQCEFYCPQDIGDWEHGNQQRVISTLLSFNRAVEDHHISITYEITVLIA